MDSYVDVVRQDLEHKMEELKPKVDEYHQLEEVLNAIEQIKPDAKPAARKEVAQAAKPAAAKPKANPSRRGRPRGVYIRAEERVEQLKQVIPTWDKRFEFTKSDLGELGVTSNSATKVCDMLVKEGFLRRGEREHGGIPGRFVSVYGITKEEVPENGNREERLEYS